MKIESRKSSFLLWLPVLSIFFYNCSSESDHQDYVDVTVGITSFIGEAASFVAEEKGFFLDNGLNVTLQVNIAGSESMKQLLAGEIDIAHIAETPILYSLLDSTYTAKNRKGELQIVANMILANRIQKVVARRDAGIDTPRDIIGKRIALARGTQSEYHLDSFLLEYQINSDLVDTVHMSAGEQLEAILKGDIDVAVTWEPNVTQIEYELGRNAIELPSKLTYSTLWLTTVLDQFAEENPEVVISYLKSLLQAQEYIHQNPRWALDLLAERTSVAVEVIDVAVQQIDYELNLSERMLHLLKEQERWMVGNGIASTQSVDVYDLIEFRFMEEVYPEGITLIR